MLRCRTASTLARCSNLLTQASDGLPLFALPIPPFFGCGTRWVVSANASNAVVRWRRGAAVGSGGFRRSRLLRAIKWRAWLRRCTVSGSINVVITKRVLARACAERLDAPHADVLMRLSLSPRL
ncbi:hypothetical protein FH972_021091 [Carpinus fangiana]|uniref:Uncharacterized protein n=1 Tax=Carpinus fangiana TaxID=176857 RepID=A0A5N6KNC1_9ROSI|nr:hypothetical protein FH972_021091 [Carpinus fangiana]